MYIPRDTERQTQPLHQFRRNRGKAPLSKKTAFDNVSFSKKRLKVNRPSQDRKLDKNKHGGLVPKKYRGLIFTSAIALIVLLSFYLDLPGWLGIV